MGGLSAAARAVLGTAPLSERSLHGGDLSEVIRLELEGGASAVAKRGPLVDREARMLEGMAATGAAVPRVLGLSGDVLVLEYLDEASAGNAGWAALGESLRRLHDATGPQYGWYEDYAFGHVAIPCGLCDNWPEFWGSHRLMADPQALPADLAWRLERLCGRLGALLPRHPPASLLHGDLWAGNALFTRDGGAYLIDPACCYGHSEVDLAMLHLFGQPGPGFEAAYGAPEPGWEARRALYQLWPALVHLRLFGGSYRGMVEARLEAVGA